MMAFGLVLIAAPVGLMVESTDDWRTAGAVSDALERTIEQSLRRTVLRLPSDASCKDQPQRCVDEARIDHRVDDLLVVRVFSGLTQHLVILQCHRLGVAEPKRSTLRLAVEGQDWTEELGAVVADLLPAEVAPEQVPLGASIARAEAGVLGPVLIVVGGISVIVAAILAERAAAAAREILTGPADRAEFERAYARRRDLRLASIGLASAGALVTAGGIGLLWFRW